MLFYLAFHFPPFPQRIFFTILFSIFLPANMPSGAAWGCGSLICLPEPNFGERKAGAEVKKPERFSAMSLSHLGS